MLPIWRLTRNRYTRRLYDRLDEAGVTATRMLEYVADVEGVGDGDSAGDLEDDERPGPDDPDDAVSYSAVPAGDERTDRLDLDFSIPVSFLDEEWVVVATAGGEAVGRTLVSADQRPFVHPLGERMAFEGAYVRRVYVAPGWRGNGVAKRLVRRAREVARTELEVDAAVALVAADNRPSRWVFEANGFRPVRQHDYVRLFGREYRRVTDRQAE